MGRPVWCTAHLVCGTLAAHAQPPTAPCASPPACAPLPSLLQPFGKNNSLADKFVLHAAVQFQPRLIVGADHQLWQRPEPAPRTCRACGPQTASRPLT